MLRKLKRVFRFIIQKSRNPMQTVLWFPRVSDLLQNFHYLHIHYHFLWWNQSQSASTRISHPLIILWSNNVGFKGLLHSKVIRNSKLFVCNTTTSGNWKTIPSGNWKEDRRQVDQAYYVCTWNEEDGLHIESFRKTNTMTTLLSFFIGYEGVLLHKECKNIYELGARPWFI